MSGIRSGGRVMRLGIALLLAGALGLGIHPQRSAAQNPIIGTVENAVLLVVVRADGIEERLDGRGALPLFEKDLLKTAPRGGALIEFKDGTRLALNERTTLRLLSRWTEKQGDTRIIRLETGEVWLKTGRRGPRMFTGARGTEVEVSVGTAAVQDGEVSVRLGDDGRAVVGTVQGNADLLTPFGTCAVGASKRSFATRGKPCSAPEAADVASSIGWTATLLK
jgi:FecR protein